jgi:hypothetical protein
LYLQAVLVGPSPKQLELSWEKREDSIDGLMRLVRGADLQKKEKG